MTTATLEVEAETRRADIPKHSVCEYHPGTCRGCDKLPVCGVYHIYDPEMVVSIGKIFGELVL
ncbi:MAG: hypothetical protein WC796_04715 [Candidatus Pacearchaeota archaeon]|jgi:hypothetical protein